MENGKYVEILTTNLKASFWQNLKTILRQNKKAVLLEFLFGSQQQSDVEEKIQTLENQVSFLQQRMIALETKLENQTIDSKYALRDQNKAAEAPKII
jgi:hypothetical protein